jgi:alanine racemase
VLSWLNPVDACWAAAVQQQVELAVPAGSTWTPCCGHERGAGAPAPGHRDGPRRAAPAEWADLCRAARAAERQGRLQVVGVMGHLPCAEDPAHPANPAGRARFAWGLRTARALGLRPADRHLAATSATLLDPRSHHTLCRVGAGLVGIDPTRPPPLRGALRLTAPLVGVRDVRAAPVSGTATPGPRPPRPAWACCRWVRGRSARVASGRAAVLVRGRRRPLVGRSPWTLAVVDLGSRRHRASARWPPSSAPATRASPRCRTGRLVRHAGARDRHRSRSATGALRAPRRAAEPVMALRRSWRPRPPRGRGQPGCAWPSSAVARAASTRCPSPRRPP